MKMKKRQKLTALLTAAVLLITAASGCSAPGGSSSGNSSSGSGSGSTAPAADLDAPVVGVEDAAAARQLREAAASSLYQLAQSDPTCTNGLLPPMYESREDIYKAIPEDAGTYKPEDIKIGQQIYMLKNDWFVEFVEGAEAAAADYGVELVTLSADGTDEGCLNAVDNLIAQGCQGLLLCAVSLDVNDALADMCTQSDVMCVGAGVPVSADTGVLTSFLLNNFWGGFVVGQVCGEALENEHIIAACSLSYWGESNSESRMAGAIAGIFYTRAQQMGLSYTQEECAEMAIEFWQQVRLNGSNASEEFDFEVVNVGESDNTEEGGQITAENAFTAHPDINLFITNNDFEGIGVCNAAESMGITLGENGCWVASVSDGNMMAIERIKEGTYLATLDSGAYSNGYSCVKLLCEILINGYDANNLPQYTCPPYEAITIENADEYYEEGIVLSRGAELAEVVTIPEYNAQQAAALAG